MANKLWYDLAACSDNPDFEDFPSLKETKLIIQAKAVCRQCPVRKECWAEAYVRGETEGIWGGTTHKERVMMGAILNIPAGVSWSVLVDTILP
jgi:WhiB family redox-sensing transcriptional regulator